MKSFEEYMENQIPGYQDFILEERLEKLKDLWNKKEEAFSRAGIILKKGLNPNAIIDYTTDLEKANEQGAAYAKQLDSEMNKIKNDLGISNEEETNNIHM